MAQDVRASGAGRWAALAVVVGAALWWALSALGPGGRADGGAVEQRVVEASPAVVPPSWESAAPMTVEAEAITPLALAPAPVEAAPEPVVAEVVEPPPAVLRVHVVTPEGRPLQAAEVTLHTQALDRASTDAAGHASFEVAPGTEVQVAARHEVFRFATARVDVPDEPGATVAVTLVLERQLSVCVRIESTLGVSIPEARVTFRETEQHVRSMPDRFLPPSAIDRFVHRQPFEGRFHETRVTTADGRCCVSGVRSGFLGIFVEAAGFVRVKHHEVEVLEPGGDLGVIRMEPAVTVRGRVRDASGAPVPDAVVESWWSAESPWRRTDAEGRFVIDTVPRSVRQVPLLVTHETRGHFYDGALPVTSAEQQITLHPPLVARLRLVDAATRAPLDGPCAVTLRMPAGQDMLQVLKIVGKRLEVHEGELDVDSVYAFGTALRLELPEYARAEVPMAEILAASGERLEVALVREGRIAVRVLDAKTGLPLPDAEFSTVSQSHRSEDKRRTVTWRRVDAEFDAAAGEHLFDTSVFTMAAGVDESLSITAKGYAACDPVPISRDGVRLVGEWVEVWLQPE